MQGNGEEKNDNVERRCILIKTNGELEEKMVVVTDKAAVAEILGGEAEFKGEMEYQRIAVLGRKDAEELEENDLGFTLTPDPGMLRGDLLAFSIGENGKPVDTSLSRFRRSKKTLRKRQLGGTNEKKEEEKEVAAPESSTDLDPDSLEVHVQGMPYEVTEEDVRQFFADCGEIQEIRLSRFQDSGKCRGFGFVRFETEEGVEAALKKDREHMGSRYVNVSRTRSRMGASVLPSNKDVVIPLDCKSIFVKNLPYDADEVAIKNVFMRFGKINTVRIPRHNDTGRMKGICYVEYLNTQSVKQAVGMSGLVEMGGRKLLVDVETGKPKNSFRTAEGRLWKNVQKGEKRAEKSNAGDSKRMRKN